MALLNNRPRLATIVCKKNCHFGILKKQYYNEILFEHEEKKFLRELMFLQ